MSTFDGWETRLYGDAMVSPPCRELMHFRTKGSKNGVRRYQTESGEWTPLGLKERKAREGWGQSRAERKAAKSVAKAERKTAKAERKVARIAARKERAEAVRIRKSKSDITKLTDAELQQRIRRAKMEQEYKELTRSPLLKNGEKLVTSLLEARAKQADREMEKAKLDLENRKVAADIIKSQSSVKRAKAEFKKAKQEKKKMRQDRLAGLATERYKGLIDAKREYRETTIRGGIAKRLNAKMNAGYKDLMQAKRKAQGEVEANRIKSKGAYNLNKEKEARAKRDREAEQRRLDKERLRARKAAERHMRR